MIWKMECAVYGSDEADFLLQRGWEPLTVVIEPVWEYPPDSRAFTEDKPVVYFRLACDEEGRRGPA